MGEEITESAKATQEVAKATSQAIKTTEAFARWIDRMAGGVIKEGMGLIESKFGMWVWERQQRFANRVNEDLVRLGIENTYQACPPKFLIPVTKKAALEDNDSLQDRWVNLLVNSCNPNSDVEFSNAFIGILDQMSSYDVQIMDKIYENQDLISVIYLGELPNTVRFENFQSQNHDKITQGLQTFFTKFDGMDKSLHATLDNLCRLNLIRRCVDVNDVIVSVQMVFGVQTFLGTKFYNACTSE